MNVILQVKAKPRARQARVRRLDETHFEVWVTEAPDKGKANEAIVEALAEFLKVAKSRLSVVSGQTSRNKRIEFKVA